MPTPDWPDAARGAKLRQLIGIARRQLGVPADAHQARVRRLTQGRVTSTRDCTLAELETILREYKASGFAPTPAPRAAPASPERWQSPTNMMLKIGALLRVLNDLHDVSESKGFSYAAGILRQQKGLPPGVACPLELATAAELRGVIAALYRQVQRARARRPAASAGNADADAAIAWLDGGYAPGDDAA
jgi:phage gp16-like protein